MSGARVGVASIPPPHWRAEDRVFCGEHTWAILSGIVLVSPGARLGLDAPLQHLQELRTREEVAESICVEAHARADRRPHASSIVVDTGPELLVGPFP